MDQSFEFYVNIVIYPKHSAAVYKVMAEMEQYAAKHDIVLEWRKHYSNDITNTTIIAIRTGNVAQWVELYDKFEGKIMKATDPKGFMMRRPDTAAWTARQEKKE